MKFKIGEVAVYFGVASITPVYALHMLKNNGEEVTVIEPSLGNIPKIYEYGIKFADGTKAMVAEIELKKKNPPEASWEEIQKSIGWNPTKQPIHE